jgi:hypothetical protein
VTAVLSGSTVWGMGPQYGSDNNSKTAVTMEKTLKTFKILQPMINAQRGDYEIFEELLEKANAFANDWENLWDELNCVYVGNCLASMTYDVNKDPNNLMHSYAQFCDQWALSMHSLSDYSKGQAGYDLCPPIAKVVGKKCYPFKDYIKHTSYGENTKLLKVLRCKKK